MGVRILRRSEVARLLPPAECLAAVEEAFAAHGRGEAPAPSVAGVPAEEGGFHVKAGLLRRGERTYVAVKSNANFPANPERHRLPTIQGVVVLADGETGTPLAVMDSIELTALRTAAATAVAVKWLARPDAATLGLVGCGVQGRAHLQALAAVRRFERVLLCDARRGAAAELAEEARRHLGAAVDIVDDPTAVALAADVCVTCTPSGRYLLDRGAARPGALVAGVGADHEDKRELAPDLLAAATVVVDVLDQCAAFGDLHHAIEARVLGRQDVHAELGEIVAGIRPGRRRDDELIVFDSTGMALQDVAAAALVFERAVALGVGAELPLSG